MRGRAAVDSVHAAPFLPVVPSQRLSLFLSRLRPQRNPRWRHPPRSAVLADRLLSERLNVFGVIGCVLCVTGSIAIVLHAPPERAIPSVMYLWYAALRPRFLAYAALATGASALAALRVPAEVARSNPLVYVGICSALGSLSVVSCQALGIAIKLTLAGDNQFVYPPTYAFAAVVVGAVVTQMNYLNRALDLFNTAIVTPLYYVAFTTLTIAASTIMFGTAAPAAHLVAQAAGFVTIVCGTALLHATKDMDPGAAAALMPWIPLPTADDAARDLRRPGNPALARTMEDGLRGGGAAPAETAVSATQLIDLRSKPR